MNDAVVMAAGEGVRLRPLTERYAKPVLPLDGRPVIATLLRELRAAGVERAWIVVRHYGEQIRALLGDGSGFGLELRYTEQPKLDGSAGAVRAAVSAGATPPFLISGADTLFTPGDVARFVAAVERPGVAGAIAVRRDPPPQPPHRRATPYLEGLGGPPFELAELFQRAVDDGLEIAAVEIGPTRDLTYPLDLLHENFTYLGSL
jgi:NDP-sugar pyrophosphorylase family protein